MHAFTRDASEIAGRYPAVQGTIAARLVEAMSGARTMREVLLVWLLTVAVLAVAGMQLARGRISPGEMLAASR